jgi:NADH:ubiquinone oxidoreductase subunit F (NADH-binding)
VSQRHQLDDLPRLLRGLHRDGRPVSLAEHLTLHGPLPGPPRHRGPDHGLIDLVGRAGLCGRGGAGFPTARKLASVAAGRRPIVVANGAEGEPLSAKDRALLTQTPHLVLDGAALAARAVGATEVIVATGTKSARSVTAAVAERAARHLDQIHATVVIVPDRFVAGEETALVSFLGEGPGLPTLTPPRPFERGVRGRPTLVQNVESLAHLALIARHGAEWFRAIGPPGEPGSTLLTVQGAVRHPGVYEVARGSRLSEVLAAAGGPATALQAFLIGGYAGAWLPARAVWDVPLCDGALRSQGGILGAGIVLAFPAEACGITETARIAAYLAKESAGQCGPCVHGLSAISAALADLARGRAPNDVVERLQDWAWQVTGRGACHHPDGAARMATSALAAFAADVATHGRHNPCAGAKGPPSVSGRAMP